MVVLMINCMACVIVDDPTYATALGLPLNNYLQRWNLSKFGNGRQRLVLLIIGNGRHATVRYCIA